MVLIRTIICMLVIVTMRVCAWTSVHHIEPSKSGKLVGNTWTYEEINIKPFNQLIFSWNGLRPKGHYIFSIRVRNKKTKRWYPWHKAAQWGNGIQKSFSGGSSASTDYNFVRLELPKLMHADGFAISIVGKQAAIKNITRVSVNTLDLQAFKHEAPFTIGNLPSILINKVPKISQMCIEHKDNSKLCSPTSITIVASYLTGESIDPKNVAKQVYDTGLEVYGSWPFNTAHGYELTKGKYYFHIERLAHFKQLHDHLKKGIPVIVSVTGNLKGAPMPYKQGHLLVVVGYDAKAKKVWCNDPAFKATDSTLVAYDLADFLKSWENSKRLSYIATRKGS